MKYSGHRSHPQISVLQIIFRLALLAIFFQFSSLAVLLAVKEIMQLIN